MKKKMHYPFARLVVLLLIACITIIGCADNSNNSENQREVEVERKPVPRRPDGPIQKMDVPFPIGVFWIPAPSKVTDEVMADIKNFGANFIVPTNGANSFNTFDHLLPMADKQGLKILVSDSIVSTQGKFVSNTEPLTENYLKFVKEFVEHYKGKPGVLGFDLKDEPTGYEAMEKLGQVQELVRDLAPGYPIFVNLFGAYEHIDVTGYNGETEGETVTTTNSIGQTFRTKAGETEINWVQIKLDKTQFSAYEELTMSIWDSPQKKKLIGSSTVPSYNANLFTTFHFDQVKVEENTDYYWEIIHAGGGDESVGWIIRTKAGDEEWYPDGQAYYKNEPINSDFMFFVNSSFYENYYRQWLAQKPDVLSFDQYPFSADGGISDAQYYTLEMLRRLSVEYNVDLWSYMQSVGISNSLRIPKEGEMRFNVYSHLAYGVKGIIYFTYYTPPANVEGFASAIYDKNEQRTEKYEFAKQNNAELSQLGPTLKQLTSLAVYHTGGDVLPKHTKELPESSEIQPDNRKNRYIVSYFEHQNGDHYAMIVNSDYANSIEETFTFQGKPDGVKHISKENGEPAETNYDSKTGKLTLSFKAGEGILLLLPSGYYLE